MVAAFTTFTWWFGQFPYIVRRTPHPELGPTCEFRLCHAFTASHQRPASTKMIREFQRHSAGLHRPCYVTTSACRALRSATSGSAWGVEPCPASSSDCEHINQLSHFHAQSFNF